jgi:2-phospho-L-lactate guanylyltransferase
MAPVSLSGTWALVPVKRLDRAKSRLSGVLSGTQRRHLAGAMLRDVFAALAAVSGLAGTLVVTGDPIAAALARSHGMLVLPDPDVAETNGAVRHGLAWLAERGAAAAVVVPGDVPFAEAEEIEAVMRGLRTAAVVLVPAARDGGTNMLGVTPPDVLAVAFGEQSFVRHRAAAREADLATAVMHLPGAAHDIDVPSDLFAPVGKDRPGHTSALLGRWQAEAMAPRRPHRLLEALDR